MSVSPRIDATRLIDFATAVYASAGMPEGPNLAKGSFPPVRKYPTVFHPAVGVSSTPSARVRRATIAARA